MAWNYAKLSKMAKDSGGPEKLVEILIKSGEKKMLPWIGVACAGSIALTIGVIKIINYFSQKKNISPDEAESAKNELIQGIKNYDTSKLATNKTAIIEDTNENKQQES